jgi:hypothetical protein
MVTHSFWLAHSIMAQLKEIPKITAESFGLTNAIFSMSGLDEAQHSLETSLSHLVARILFAES